MKNAIKSNFVPSQSALLILKNGGILQTNESPAEMIERIVAAIVESETSYSSNNREIQNFAESLTNLMDSRKIVFSTPVMTNAGIRGKPLSACTVPPISLLHKMGEIKEMVDIYHQDGLGTGFNFDDLEDPLSMLHFLNDVAINGAVSGLENRPVGNIALLSVTHPMIKEFICAKTHSQIPWKFNISVNIDDNFILAYQKNKKYQLVNGKEYYAREVFDLIATSAFICGDPGVVFMNRLNYDNPVPELGNYQSVAPCAEVGLLPGESCQFGYLNLNEFFDNNMAFDKLGLISAVRILTRSLDDALDINIRNFRIKLSAEITQAKRKIGIGICGVADLLAKLKIPYDTNEGRELIKNLILLINYVSKDESCELGKIRGSFSAFLHSLYTLKPGFIERKYGQNTSLYIHANDWKNLADKIRKVGCLRNCSTISIPPTGRSGLIIDASTGIEPFFNLLKNGSLHPELLSSLKKLNALSHDWEKHILENGGCQNIGIPFEISKIYKTATEIHPQDQLKMVSEIQQGVDESISKTINLPDNTSIDELKSVLIDAYAYGLKGVTIYINNRRSGQPIKLVK